MVFNDEYACWDIDISSIPQRSILYHLKPIAIETPFTESLTSYISRLAQRHRVSTRDLITKELFPLFGRSYLLNTYNSNNITAFWKDASALNGLNKSTDDLVSVLKKVTLQGNLQFLTMLT